VNGQTGAGGINNSKWVRINLPISIQPSEQQLEDQFAKVIDLV